MDMQNLNISTIKALRHIIGQIAEVVTGDIKFSLNDESSKVASVLELKEVANEAALIYELPDPCWQALLEAALPQAQVIIDEDDELPDVEARELIDGLSEAEPESVGDQLVQHRINQAAIELHRLMNKGNQTTVEDVVTALTDRSNVGSGPYQGFWDDFVREHREEIMLQLSLELSDALGNVRDMLNDTDSDNGDDRQTDAEHRYTLEEALSIGVEQMIEEHDLGRRVQNVLQEIEARVLADVVVYDPSELKSFNGFGQKSLEELETALSEYGLELGMDISESERDRFRSVYRIKNLLRMPVAELDFSVRTHNCLEAANIETVGELIEHEKDDLLKYPNFSRKSLEEVIEALDERGLQLGMDVDDYL